jgi:uncharacterized protein YegL
MGNKKIKEESNKAKETEIVVVLDRSGSMQSIAQSTVDGFNTFLNEQQNAEGDAYITLVQFDDRYEMDYKSIPVSEAKPLINGETFSPRGMTALFDAIGKTINELETDRDVVFVIITDGHENASREYKRDAVMKMIEDLEKNKGWYFLFLGANQDAIKAGGDIGISMNKSFTYSANGEGTANAFASFSSNITNYRSSKFKNMNLNDIDLMSLKAQLDFTNEQREDKEKK